jgi:ribosomal 30S subunit maturation factor RimM
MTADNKTHRHYVKGKHNSNLTTPHTTSGGPKSFAMSDNKSHRLYVKGKHISYQRGKRNTNPGTSLLKLEGVDDTAAAQWYAGKRVAVREQTTHGWHSGD